MNKEEPLNITNLRWSDFIMENQGKMVAYMQHFPNSSNCSKVVSCLPSYITCVDIPKISDNIDRIKQTIHFWSIAIYHHYPFITEYHINRIRVSKETFISTLEKDHPTHLEWFLFHTEWLT